MCKFSNIFQQYQTKCCFNSLVWYMFVVFIVILYIVQLFMFLVNLSYGQLLMYGVHVGHSLANTYLYASWMILGFRKSTAVINLFKSVVAFRITFLLFSNILSLSGPIWFINMDKSVEKYVRYAAVNCGEFSVTSRWLRGAISNYSAIFNSYRRLMQLSGIVLSSKKKSFKKFFNNWFTSRYTWPRAIFISSLHTSFAPAKEAIILKIPTISVVDTNSWTQVVNIPIPGNDESLGCMVFYNDIVSNFILSRKFNQLSMWFFNIRSASRVINFTDWVSSKYSLNQKYDLSKVITFKPNLINYYVKSMGLFFSVNSWDKSLSDTLDLSTYKKVDKKDLSLIPVYISLRKKILVSVNIHFFKKIWHFRGFFKKGFLTNDNFNSKFLKKGFYKKRFSNNLFYEDSLKHPNLGNLFLKTIVYIYFLKKYYSKRVFKNHFSNRVFYWNSVIRVLTDLYNSKSSLWSSNNKVNNLNTFSSLFLKKKGRFSLKSFNDSILLSKASINKLKFFIYNISFDSRIPKYLLYWNSSNLIPNSKFYNDSFGDYFFRKTYLSNNYYGKISSFKGFLTNDLNKKVVFSSINPVWIWF